MSESGEGDWFMNLAVLRGSERGPRSRRETEIRVAGHVYVISENANISVRPQQGEKKYLVAVALCSCTRIEEKTIIANCGQDETFFSLRLRKPGLMTSEDAFPETLACHFQQ